MDPGLSECCDSQSENAALSAAFFCSGQNRKIAAHGGHESVIECFADQRMPDRNLRELRNGVPERAEVLLVEVVTRIHPQTGFGRVSGRDRAARQRCIGIATGKSLGIWT